MAEKERDASKEPERALEIPAELFDWDTHLTLEQIKDIESKIDPLADNLDELAESIETADGFINSENRWNEQVVCDAVHGTLDFSGYSGYSDDVLAWTQACLLSSKNYVQN